jgi:hypothetical protein
MATLIESTVRVTTRHTENAPIASVAATASFRRVDATGAERPLKPQAPDDRIMVRYPLMRGRITHAASKISQDGPAILRRQLPRKWQNGGKAGGYARYISSYARYSIAYSSEVETGSR